MISRLAAAVLSCCSKQNVCFFACTARSVRLYHTCMTLFCWESRLVPASACWQIRFDHGMLAPSAVDFALQGHFEEAVSCSYETVLLGHRSGQSQLIATSTVNVGKVGQRYVEMLAEVVARLVKDGHGRPAAKVIHDFHACPAPTLPYPTLPCIQDSFQSCPASMTFVPALPCPALPGPALPCPALSCVQDLLQACPALPCFYLPNLHALPLLSPALAFSCPALPCPRCLDSAHPSPALLSLLTTVPHVSSSSCALYSLGFVVALLALAGSYDRVKLT